MWGSWTLAHLAWDQYPVLACFAFYLPQAQPHSLFHFGPDLPLSPLALHLLTILIWNQNRTPSSVWIKLSFLHTIFTYAFLKIKKNKKPISTLTCVKNLQSMGLKTQKHADYIYITPIVSSLSTHNIPLLSVDLWATKRFLL